MTMDASRYLSTREAMAIERSSKNNSTREKLTQGITEDTGSFVRAPVTYLLLTSFSPSVL